MVRKYFEYLQFSSSDIINPKFKKKFLSTLLSFENNKICDFQTEIGNRIIKISLLKENFMSSVDIKLLIGHIHNITRFKLLLPKSRLSKLNFRYNVA